jgi:hypothetical protein
MNRLLRIKEWSTRGQLDGGVKKNRSVIYAIRVLMQLIRLLPVALLLLLASCSEESMGKFDNFLFVRQGGGEKTFTLAPTHAVDTVEVSISRYDFRDTVIQFRCGSDPSNSVMFVALDNALRGRTLITGDFHQPTNPTGTWAHLYMVRGMTQYEITNTNLRDELLGFEAIIERHLQ